MAVGRISGPLLKNNLLREGVDLAFETDLLYLDVNNGRIGIKTTTPTHDLTVDGTTRTTDLIVDNQATVGTAPDSVFTISGNTIASTNSTINLEPGSAGVVYQAKLYVNNNLEVTTNSIQTTDADADLEFNTTGSGEVNVNSNMYVDGNLHVTGNITADGGAGGNINIGSDSNDNVTFNADIDSDIIPNNPLNVPVYDLGSASKPWKTAYINDVEANSINANSILVGGIDLALPQGKIYYVAQNGSDTALGTHEHSPFATIKKALSEATVGDTVYVYPGTYEEQFPLEIPAGVTVRGASLRSVVVKPTAATMYLDCFHMNGEATVEDFTITGFYHDPTGTYSEFPGDTNGTGHSVRFSFGIETATRSPYIRNFTVITKGTASVLSVNSIKTEVIATLNRLKSIIDEIVVNGVVTKTSGNPEDPVLLLPASDGTTGTRLQGLFDDIVYIINNGTLRTSLPTITPNGTAVTTGVLANAAALLEANRDFIIAEAYAYSELNYPGACDQAKCEQDIGRIIDALKYDIVRGGNEHTVYAGLAYWVHPTDDPRGYDRGDAGHGALVDGGVVSPNSNEAAMLFHSVTFLTPASETLIAKNGARVEWLNSFTYFAGKGLYATSEASGFAGQGKTRLRINNRAGTWAVGNTLSYYDTNGTTLLASGTIDSIDGDYVNLTGRVMSLIDLTKQGFETITDRVGKTVYPQGNAKLSTTQKKFGTASLALDGSGDYVTIATQPDFDFGTGDFTIEGWFYRSVGSVQVTLFDFRTAATQHAPWLFITSGGTLAYYVNGSTRISGAGGITVGSWHHVAVSRSGTSTKIYVDGTQVGSTWTDTTTYIQSPVTIGARYTGATEFFNGYIDDVRISKGVARYTGSTYTVPTIPLTGDINTVLLLHFNGSNNSITFLDDGVTYQDLRTSAGGTATLINFADYSDFGAEIRSIGSANVYGEYGAYGDGPGVIAYLISQNFAYVGAGKLTNNDPNDRISANEVVELNGAHIYRTSVDNEGNFRVGDNFYVNQKTGEVLFDSQALTVTSINGVVFTDGVNTTTVTSTDITTGNIKISGNTIESLTGDVNVTAASGAINLQNNTYVTGNLDVTGDVTIGGNITIGNEVTDTINFVAGIDSDLIPSQTATYDLGTSGLRWKTAFINRLEVDNLVVDNNTISTTSGNDNLTLQANGAGLVYVPNNNVQIDQSLTVTTDLTVTTGTTYLKNTNITGDVDLTGDINQTGNFVTSGNTQVTGNITGTGYVQLPQIRLENNVISTTVTNTDLELQANGTGNVVVEGIQVSDNNIQSIATNSNITLVPQGTGGVIVNSNQSVQIPVGTDAQRPASPTNGMIRYNTDRNRYEGYNNGYWLQLSGVISEDGKTRVLAESSPGANNNVIYSYVNNTLMSYIDSTKLWADRFETAGIAVYDNNITSVVGGTDINVTTTGTGGVRVGNLKIYNNTITNIVNNAVTEFSETGTGYIKIAGSNGLVIPYGDTYNDRPSTPETGMMRFNTDGQLVEIFNGVTWTSVAGTSGGVTAAEALEIGIAAAIIFG